MDVNGTTGPIPRTTVASTPDLGAHAVECTDSREVADAIAPTVAHDPAIAEFTEISGTRQDVAEITRAPTIPLSKRVLDIVVASGLLVLSAPLIALIALVVRWDGGRVFFTQRRLGQDGEIIYIRKFRSMVADAEERLEADPEMHAKYIANGFKLRPEDDPRISRWGHFLRSSSLDELPQLLSVIKGDMSMVGPRPIIEPEIVEYTVRGAADAYLAARPGLTGLWQVSGRSDLNYDQRIALDLRYLERYSFGRDLKILARTVLVVLRRIGAH